MSFIDYSRSHLIFDVELLIKHIEQYLFSEVKTK